MSYIQESPMEELQKQSHNIIADTVSVPTAPNQTCLAIQCDHAVLYDASYWADRQKWWQLREWGVIYTSRFEKCY